MGLAKPFEVSIETNTSCNYDCEFCFTTNFFGRTGQSSSEQLKKVIERIASEGIDRVRFTGGEPLLRKDIGELVSFAKEQGLFTSLNTNGSLLSSEIIEALSGSLDDLLVSFHASSEADEITLGGQKGVFAKRMHAMKDLASQGVFVRAATILSKQNIAKLDKFNALVSSLPVSQWVLLRQIPSAVNKNPVSATEIVNAVEKIAGFNKGLKKSERHLIENALPFCCYSPNKVKKVALGGLREDGHSTLFIDSSLSIKPSYFFDLPLGNALQTPVMTAWESDFMKRLHSLEFIAKQCHKCKHVKQCMGGSRFSALVVNGSLYALDPLALPQKFL